jgi:cytochrome c553
MCFKENASMTTIESTPLNGGACNGKYTVNDMKAKGWSVDDIKISQTATGMNFIYILKTASTTQVTPVVTGNQADMEARIVEKLEKKKEAEAKAKEVQEIKEATIDGEKVYTTKCQSCHGTNGEKSAYNSSRPLKTLSVEDMNEAIKDYKVGRMNSANSTIMVPYANYLDEKTIKGIHGYLSNLNNK